MLLRLFLLFTLVPIVEIYILIQLGGMIGALETILLVIGTGFWGAYLARREGIRVWGNIQFEMKNGKLPGDELLDGFLIFIAGVVLITPGLLTDISGFLLLIPQSRAWFKQRIKKLIQEKMRMGRMRVDGFSDRIP